MSIDELSRVIGKLEGTIASMQKELKRQGKKVDRIDSTLTAHRLKVAGIATTTSAGITALGLWIKSHWGN